MPKYLIQGSYSEQGLQGVLKEGGSKRREAAEHLKLVEIAIVLVRLDHVAKGIVNANHGVI